VGQQLPEDLLNASCTMPTYADSPLKRGLPHHVFRELQDSQTSSSCLVLPIPPTNIYIYTHTYNIVFYMCISYHIYIIYIYISLSLSLYIVYTYFYINRKGILSCDEKPVTDLLASALSTEECKFTELVGGKTLIRSKPPKVYAFREGNEVGQNSIRS
jgi:hypothetical protein